MAHARAEHPREACGLLLGIGGRILRAEPTRNVAARPERSFEIEPAALLRWHRTARGMAMTVIGWYHSHPNGVDKPSATDAARAVEDGKLWLIATDAGVTAWRVVPNGAVHGRFEAVTLAAAA